MAAVNLPVAQAPVVVLAANAPAAGAPPAVAAPKKTWTESYNGWVTYLSDKTFEVVKNNLSINTEAGKEDGYFATIAKVAGFMLTSIPLAAFALFNAAYTWVKENVCTKAAGPAAVQVAGNVAAGAINQAANNAVENVQDAAARFQGAVNNANEVAGAINHAQGNVDGAAQDARNRVADVAENAENAE
jgi:hypothetical protein